METKKTKAHPIVVILFRMMGAQHRLVMDRAQPGNGTVERRATAALGEITWIPPGFGTSPKIYDVVHKVIAAALLQVGTDLYHPIPQGFDRPTGVYASSAENPTPTGEHTLTILLDGEVSL